MPIEAEMFENAHTLAVAWRRGVEWKSPLDVRQRAEGEFLRRVVEALQPMLRESMRSHRILLASDPYGVVALESDGSFVHVDIADQQDALDPLEVLCAEASLVTLLNRIEAELVAADTAGATCAADIVRLARYSLDGAAAEAGGEERRG